MNTKFNKAYLLIAFLAVVVQSCYEQQHFDMPNSEAEDNTSEVTVPFPFDSTRQIGTYLIKKGTPDYSKMTVHGFTDFAPEIASNESSWYEGVDIYSNKFFACRPHKNFYAENDADNFGGEKFSYQYNDLTSRILLPQGKGKQWYVYAKMAVNTLGNDSRPTFYFEGGKDWQSRSSFGLDWHTSSQPYYYLYRNGGLKGPLDYSYYKCYNSIIPGEAFELELGCVDGLYFVRIDGKVKWTFADLSVNEHLFPLIFRPWMNSVEIYDLYIEGGVESLSTVATQHENGYTTIQAPTLVNIDKEVVLFAEGRKENVRRTDNIASVRSNATDIITRRSMDGGDTWSEWSVVEGGDESVNMYPEVIHTADKMYLFYTVDESGKQNDQYHIAMRTSEDGGRSWSEDVKMEITIPEGMDIAGYSFITLTGRGIQTQAGRLIIPVYCKFGSRGTVATLYSDDEGANWTLSTMLDGLRNNSATVVEMEDKLLMVVGHTSGGTSRKYSESVDGGATWSIPTLATIPTSDGQASNGVTLKNSNGTLIHFSADSYKKGTNFTGGSLNSDLGAELKSRNIQYLYRPESFYCGGMICTISNDNGGTWSAAESLIPYVSYKEYNLLTGKVDAVLLNDHTALVVVEGGAGTPYDGLISFKKTW